MKLNKKIIEVLENNEFWVHEVEKQDNGYYVEISQYTPLGEDWWVTIWFDGTDEDFITQVEQRFLGFDVDEEVEIWVENRGKNGVPSSIRALVEDAEWKENTLCALSDDLNNIYEELLGE